MIKFIVQGLPLSAHTPNELIKKCPAIVELAGPIKQPSTGLYPASAASNPHAQKL
jgi:hypothetical protein